MTKDIAHYGVKGMRWGVRKDRKKSVDISTLSDAELKAAVNRLNLEQQYSTLTSKKAARQSSTMSKGSKIVGDVLLNSGKQVGSQLTTKLMITALNAAIKEGRKQARKPLRGL